MCIPYWNLYTNKELNCKKLLLIHNNDSYMSEAMALFCSPFKLFMKNDSLSTERKACLYSKSPGKRSPAFHFLISFIRCTSGVSYCKCLIRLSQGLKRGRTKGDEINDRGTEAALEVRRSQSKESAECGYWWWSPLEGSLPKHDRAGDRTVMPLRRQPSDRHLNVWKSHRPLAT